MHALFTLESSRADVRAPIPDSRLIFPESIPAIAISSSLRSAAAAQLKHKQMVSRLKWI